MINQATFTFGSLTTPSALAARDIDGSLDKIAIGSND